MVYTAYNMLNICSLLLIGTLGLVMAAMHIPVRSDTRHYRSARTFLCMAFILLSLIKVLEIVTPKASEDELTSCYALIVAAFQALCFTMSIMILISPRRVAHRWVGWKLLLPIALASLVLVVAQRKLPFGQFRLVLVGCSLLYVAMLAYFTWVFRNAYQHFKAEMFACYQEDELNRQLRWVSHTFYSSLAVGSLAFFSISGVKLLDCVFVVLYTAFYVYLTIQFINYSHYASLVWRADEPVDVLMEEAEPSEPASGVLKSDEEAGAADVAQSRYALIGARLEGWVNEKKYLLSNVAVKDVAAELGTTPRRLNEYFRRVVGEDFVKWRIGLRLRHACQLIDENPDRPIQEIVAASGFGDRSYFYRKFAELQGVTVAEYKRQAKLRSASQKNGSSIGSPVDASAAS